MKVDGYDSCLIRKQQIFYVSKRKAKEKKNGIENTIQIKLKYNFVETDPIHKLTIVGKSKH